MKFEPATVAYDANGVPYSPAYGDIYHSADSGPGQARHVFLGGNELPGRWAGARVFTILETGFGFGLNFLATWEAWRADPARPERLHFVSIERHPFDRDALDELHGRYPALAELAHELRRAWPPLVPGLHRLHFEDGRVTLTLAFGDVQTLVPGLRLTADAIYLDGFAPDRNPDMWSPKVMKGLARLSRPGTTLATWSAARSVRDALEAAGYTLEKRPGFGHKREMLAARYAPRWPVRVRPEHRPARARHAIVVGAGLAGAALCERLGARGWRIDLIERSPRALLHGFAGIFHPHVSPDDCIRSRFARGGFLYSLSRWRALERAGASLEWSRCGALLLAEDAEHWTPERISNLGYPFDFARYAARERAEALCGATLRSGGWWFAEGGWIQPASLVAAQLAAATDIQSHYGVAVHAIARDGETWRALGADGAAIAAAPVLILANSSDCSRLAPVGAALRRVRGQVTFVPENEAAAPSSIVAGAGYVLPAIGGLVVTGSTYHGDDDPAPRAADHEANLMRLARLLPDAVNGLDAARLDGAVGFRAVAPDRMPLAGALPDLAATRQRQSGLAGAHLPDLPRAAGLYCVSGLASRGLVWAALAAEIVASRLEGEPLPVEGDLADAVDPARFVLRQLRAGRL